VFKSVSFPKWDHLSPVGCVSFAYVISMYMVCVCNINYTVQHGLAYFYHQVLSWKTHVA